MQILALKELKHFFCPACGGAVVFKAGPVKIPHFAHRSRTGCERFSEPETSLHLTGKMLLHRFFSEKKLPSELERYFPIIKQRADVFVDGKWAVEFQCSPLSSAEVTSRSYGYASIFVKPLWIRGMDEMPQDGIQLLKLQTFEWTMRWNINGIDYLLGYHPETDQFFYRSSLFYLGGLKWAGKTKSLAAQKQSFPFAVPRKLTRHEFAKIHSFAMQEKHRFIQRQQFSKNRYQNAYWVLCYELGLDRMYLPSYIGVPIKGAEIFRVHPVVWQLQMLAAEARGQKAWELIHSKESLFWNGAAETEALAIIEDYLHFAKAVQTSDHSLQEIEQLLYAIYCKYL